MRYRSWWFALVVLDATLIAASLAVSMTLYYGGNTPPHVVTETLPTLLPVTVALVLLFNTLFGLYRRDWRYAGLETAVSVGLSVTPALTTAALFGRLTGMALPVIVWCTTCLLSLLATLGTRFFWRIMQPRVEAFGSGQGDDSSDSPRSNVLIYGAGSLGCSLARMIQQQAHSPYSVVGFVDDDPQARRIYVGGLRVLGNGEDLGELIDRHEVAEVIVAIDGLSRTRLSHIQRVCADRSTRARLVPSLMALLEEHHAPPPEATVEELLGRTTPALGAEASATYLAGKTVLITGAGGSIGSELSRQICAQNPRHVILLGRGENRIHWIYLQLHKKYAHIQITPIIHNIAVTSGLECIFDQYRPDIVFHAAAHKHVYLMEDVPVEAARNNVLATRELARLASEYAAERFIFISTDKAVSPTSVMGATKRACELLLMSRESSTRFICVRFGNVLGSDGSVLEIFRRQWRNHEPLTVTHPDATRFFMSIPEACFLVLQAGCIGQHGDILLLDMGQPISIRKLAEDFIRMHGGNPADSHAIQYTGLRHGERLHEALVHDAESLQATTHPLISRVAMRRDCCSRHGADESVRQLQAAVRAEDDARVVQLLNSFTEGSLSHQEPLQLHRSVS